MSSELGEKTHLSEVDTIFLEAQDNGIVEPRHKNTAMSEITLKVDGRTGLSSVVTLSHFHRQVTGKSVCSQSNLTITNTFWLNHVSTGNVFQTLCYAKFIKQEFAAVDSEIPHGKVLFERGEANSNNRGFKLIS